MTLYPNNKSIELKVGRMEVRIVPLDDRDFIQVDEFLIQNTDGRCETTIWVNGQGWMTMKQLIKLGQKVQK